MEHQVLAVRDAHPSWGGRKIHARLKHTKHNDVPAPSTITSILHRHGLIDPAQSAKRQATRRFERAEPNELWQMDFKGEFRMSNGQWCYPLTVLDDHSRYSIHLGACSNQTCRTVQDWLIQSFRRYGLPHAMLMDNGTPWAVSHTPGGYTKLTAWLIRLDIRVIFGRPYHPQTQGKEERFHRTLKTELLHGRHFDNLSHTQSLFDPWRQMYNHERPHEALGMAVPASRYRISMRTYPEHLPTIEYSPQDQVRKANPVGQFHYHGRVYKISEAFAGQHIGLRSTVEDGMLDLYFCQQRIGQLNLHSGVIHRATVSGSDSVRCAHSSGPRNTEPVS